MILLLGLMAGCSGPNDETLLDELRVFSMIPGAPEIAAMETTEIDVRIVDPAGQGGRTLVWTCTLLGETCLEDDEGRQVEVVEPEDGHVYASFTASAALAAVASETPVPFTFVWALACTDGTCPIFDQVDAGDTIDPLVWANPFDWAADLPIGGTSLAYTTISISTRNEDDRHVNPTLRIAGDSEAVNSTEELKLTATADGELGDEAKFWNYAEDGGFSSTDERVGSSNDAVLTYVAGKSAGEVNAYVLLVDSLGGSALWEGSLTVQ